MSICPCGTGRSYDACCGPLHRGEARAATPEALMRSRYAAYAKRLVPYLVATQRPPGDAEQIAESCRATRWTGLTIVEATGGGLLDATGVVAFDASYVAGKRPGVLRERSRFVPEDGAWYYLDGTMEDS